VLAVRDLEKTFGAVRAVDAVTLNIPEGQMVGIIGRSGAGKSTLLRLVNRLLEPSNGRIAFNDEDVGSLRGQALRDWRTRCAMIFQQFNLIDRLDVITNVLVGRVNHRRTLPTLFKNFRTEDRALAIRALERLDLADAALQRTGTLSGGQQQRVAIARALVQGPRIVLADEPIASLDPRNAARVMEALRTINRQDGITVVCNLHQVESAKSYCDRIIGMARGRIVFDGTPQSLTLDDVREIYGVEGDDEELRDAVSSVEPASAASPITAPLPAAAAVAAVSAPAN